MQEYQQQEQQHVHQEHEVYQTINDERGYHPVVNAESIVHYQQPSSTPVFTTPPPHTDARFLAVLCYSLGWFSGLLFALFTRENRYVRYHAWQSILFFGGINLIDAIFFMSLVHRLSWLYLLVPGIMKFALVLGFMLLNFIAFVGWLVAIFQAYKGSYYRMPVVGNIVARSFAVETVLK